MKSVNNTQYTVGFGSQKLDSILFCLCSFLYFHQAALYWVVVCVCSTCSSHVNQRATEECSIPWREVSCYKRLRARFFLRFIVFTIGILQPGGGIFSLLSKLRDFIGLRDRPPNSKLFLPPLPPADAFTTSLRTRQFSALLLPVETSRTMQLSDVLRLHVGVALLRLFWMSLPVKLLFVSGTLQRADREAFVCTLVIEHGVVAFVKKILGLFLNPKSNPICAIWFPFILI